MSGGYYIRGFEVFGWSISGNETCACVKKDGQTFMFDVGIAPSWSKSAAHVFIRWAHFPYTSTFSHGHIDHIGAICQHIRKRDLNRLPPATYYLLPHLVDSVRALCDEYCKMQGKEMECFRKPNLVTLEPGSSTQVKFDSKRWRGVFLNKKNIYYGYSTVDWFHMVRRNLRDRPRCPQPGIHPI